MNECKEGVNWNNLGSHSCERSCNLMHNELKLESSQVSTIDYTRHFNRIKPNKLSDQSLPLHGLPIF